MARLRRDSCESYHGASLAGADVLKENSKQTKRSSPRKKAPKSYAERKELYDDDSLQLLKLTPKKISPPKKSGKQVRLGSLRTLQTSSAAFALELGPATLRRPSSPTDLLSPAKAKQFSRRRVQLPSDPEPVREINDCADDQEAEVEESILCGSNDTSSRSEEELPSPSEMITLASPKSDATQTIGHQADSHDLAGRLSSLTILESDPASVAAPPVIKSRSSLQCLSSPVTSSDEGNHNKAILRFSPPRLHSPRKERTPDRPGTPPPLSPSKGKLQSPSKGRARMPTPPHRPSIEAFWNAETVNEWNDQYSPRKEWRSPRKLQLLRDEASTSPTSSPRKLISPFKRTKAEIEAKRSWDSRKHEAADDFLSEIDQKVTGGKIQELAASTGGVRFIWSKTLNSTAGRAIWRRETTKSRQPDGTLLTTIKHHASIELAEKVIDDDVRLRNVIAHEFCHLCNFMISGIKDQPHGRQFKEWGLKTTRAFNARGVEVTTKHSYQIEYKYIWRCSNEDCAVEFKRHSKSIDVKRHTCGSCRSKLVQVKPVPRKDAGAGATGYAAYVKRHFAAVKQSMPGASQKEIMEAVGRKYRAEKEGGSLHSQSGLRTPSDEDDEGFVPKAAEVDKVARVLEFITLDDD